MTFLQLFKLINNINPIPNIKLFAVLHNLASVVNLIFVSILVWNEISLKWNNPCKIDPVQLHDYT